MTEQAMSISRETLFDEIWKEPMTVVAARYGVSSNFLARICARLRVPCPPRGFWAKKRAGIVQKVPPLPKPQPGDELEWVRGARGERVPSPPPSPQRKRSFVPEAPNLVNPDRHSLLDGIEEHFKPARISSVGHMRPNKRLMADFFIGRENLPRAINLANRLFRHLESRGHRVQIIPTGEYHPRPFLNPCIGKESEPWESWHPSRPTVVMIGTLAIGLTIFEVSEEAEAEYRNGKYVRLSDLPPKTRRSRIDSRAWTTHHEFLTGRLGLRAYSPYNKTSWTREWLEAEPGSLTGQFDEIANVLKRRASLLATEVKAIREQERIEQEKWMAQRRKWEIEEAERRAVREREEAERRRLQAIKDSHQELHSIISKWDEAKRIQRFFEAIQQRSEALEEADRAILSERLIRAREFLGETEAIELFRKWRTPEER